MPKGKKRKSLTSLVEKYREVSVVQEIENNLEKQSRALYPVSELSLDDLYDESNYDLDSYPTLTTSLEKDGFLLPLILTPDSEHENRYLILNGAKRFLLGKNRLHLSSLPGVVATLSPERKKLYVLENILQEGGCPLTKTHAFRVLLNSGYSEEEIAKACSLSVSSVKNLLRLEKLPPFLKEGLKKGLLSYGQARALLDLPVEVQESLYQEIQENRLSVRELEHQKRRYQGKEAPLLLTRKGRRLTITFADEKSAQKVEKKLSEDPGFFDR